jgi:Asp-tRNA(Asn)/Glu-tRNA(Gln) amidotransferase A subunit family amidase
MAERSTDVSRHERQRGGGAFAALLHRPSRRSRTLTLTRASELLRAKAVSSVELTRACLARIERFNGPLNAFITVTADRAVTTAREMDAAAAW